MKTRLLKSILALAMLFVALPMVAQDYLKIYFKDGHTERHFMHLVDNISVTKYDLEGNLHSDYQMQQIVMKDITYSYYIADIDSMSFTKVDEEQVQKNATAVANSIEPIFNQCESIEDMEQHLDEIKNIDGVENVYSTGTDIVVQVKDWYNIVYNYFLSQEEPLVTNNANELASRLKNKANLVNSANTTKPKVAIAFQMVDDLSREWQLNLMIDLKENLERKGYEVKIIADEEKGDEKLDSDFYLTRMFDYDMLLLFTHGLSYGGKHALYTGEGTNSFMGTIGLINIGLDWVDNKIFGLDIDDVGIASCNVGTERLGPQKYKKELKYYWYVSENLIKKSSAKFNGSGTHIVFIGACEQLYGKKKSITFGDETEYYGDSFAQVLFDKGADFVAGYTKGAIRSCNASNNFYRNLLNGFSLEASLDYLPEIQKKEKVVAGDDAKGARLIGLYNPNANEEELKKFFLFKTKTKQISEQELAETYKSGNVVLSGTTTAEYPITKDFGDPMKYYPITGDLGDPMESSQLVCDYEKARGYGGTPKKLRCGFRHGLDPNLSKDYQEVYSENPQIEEKTTDNVHFSCNITLPSVCDTYYYQAFTFDGYNYNYGKICSFTLNKPVVYPNLKLSVTDPISLVVGESTKIKVLAGSGKYSVKISNNKVTVKVEDDEVIIEAVSEGPVTITVIDTETYQAISVEIEVVKKAEIPEGAIDLGLPSGTLWAAYNVGASKPEEYGLYFAWGETQGYRADERHYFGWSTYKWSNGGYNKLTKYCTNADYGTVDNKTTLDLEDDAARVNWGMPWRMPTHEQIEELKDNCWTDWAEKNGVSGMLYTSKINGKSVFFPAAGIRWEFELDWDGSGSWFFWSSTVNEKQPCFAYDLSRDSYIYSGGRYVYTYNRYFGRSVRAVISGGQEPAPNLALASTAPVSLTIGETTKVMIISGNGQYSIRNSNPDAVSANILNNAVEIKALQPGEATITVIDDVSNQTVSFTVTVAKKLVNLVLSTYDPITLQVNAGVTFTIESGNGNYTVKSSDEAVATVNLRGNYVDVRGVAPGTATITVTDVESGQTATIQVTVAKKLVNLVLSTYDPITLNVNAGVTFKIESGNGNYTVKSSDNTVATVNLRDNYVDVHGVAPGTATITVTDVESGQTASIVVTVAAPVCPARITNVELTSTQYHRDEDNQNQMYYKVSARLDDLTDIEEWGICYHRTTISEFPFESVSNEQYINMRYSIANSNLGKSTTLLKTDFNAYVATYDGEVGVYVKKRDKTSGNLMTIYGDLYSFSLRYDKKPSFVLFSPAIKETKVVSTSGSHKQYETTVTYNYTVEGVFWIDYIAFGVSGNGWSDGGSSKWYLQKDHTSDSYTTERYWDNSKLNHSIFEKLYLRNSKLIYSNYINMSGSGMITNVWTSTSPAYTSRQMEPDEESADGESENDVYMNYVEFNVPAAKDKQAETRRAIRQIPYYEGVLEEVVSVQE